MTTTIQHTKALKYKGPEHNSMHGGTLDRVVVDLAVSNTPLGHIFDGVDDMSGM